MADLVIRRQDYESFLATIVNNDGSPVDLSGKTVWMTIKPTPLGDPGDGDAIFKFHWAHNGTTVTSSVGFVADTPLTLGRLHLVFLPADTEGNTIKEQVGKTLVYDVQLLLATNVVKTWDKGTFRIDPDVTQRRTTP